MPVSAILLISFFALLIFNVPVGYSLGCSALITILLGDGICRWKLLCRDFLLPLFLYDDGNSAVHVGRIVDEQQWHQ